MIVIQDTMEHKHKTLLLWSNKDALFNLFRLQMIGKGANCVSEAIF